MSRDGDSNASRTSLATVLALALIVGCGVAAYSDSFTTLFAGLDGKESIRDNPHIRHIWPLSEAISLPMWKPPLNLAETPTVAHRPTFSFSLALTNRLFGFTPAAHHAVNLAIHIAAALVLFGIVRRTLAPPRFPELDASRATWLALAAALLWLVHPLQTESVTYIVQRAESLMGFFLLLTVYCALRALDGGRRLWWQASSTIACLLAAGCKETTIVAPFLVILYDYTFAPRTGRRWRRPGFYAVLAAAAWTLPLTYSTKIATYVEGIRPLPFALAQPEVILHYLRLSFWPDRLFLYVNTHVFDVHSTAEVVLPAAVLVALFAATVWALVRRHWLGFLGGWFFLTLGPTSSVIPISDVIQEHRMYVPLAALAVLAAVTGAYVVGRLARSLSPRQRAIVDALVLATVVLALGARTYARNLDYHHEFAMVHPADLHEDYTILADHYLSEPGLVEAEADRARALLDSAHPDPRDVTFAHFVIGLAAARDGKPEQAEEELQHVVAAEPGFAYARHHLGVALREKGDAAGAIVQFREANRLRQSAYTHKELAVALEDQGDTTGAEAELQLAMRLQPGFGEAFYELGILALRRGDKQLAASYFTQALRNRPDLAEPHYELAMLHKEHGDVANARAELEAAVELRPEYAEANRELALLLEAAGDRDGAIDHLKQAVHAKPRMASEQLKLARLLQEEDDQDGAQRHLRRFTRVRPEELQIRHELARMLMNEGKKKQAVRQLERLVEPMRARVEERSEEARVREELATVETELGMLLAQRGEIDEAIEHLEESVRLRPDSARAHTELGIALRTRGDDNGAVAQLEKAIDLQPESPDAYKALGIVMRDRGDLDRAAKNFEKAVTLDPDFADAHNELGWVLQLQGDLEGAAEHYERALEIRPDHAEARARLREVQAKLASSGGARGQGRAE